MQFLVYHGFAYAENAQRVRLYRLSSELFKIRNDGFFEHLAALVRRTGKQHDAHAISFESAARRGAAGIVERRAVNRKHRLLYIAFGHMAAVYFIEEVVAQRLGFFLVQL
ncbi:hypothetical protein SDC9_134684 [bioreactor metagenome]|uniref:Uncharacterized protein n=1 Tax=bioreactor metagenome TaxID=1076179 RepID=A0A645DDU0_9ZZZZ